MAFSRRPARFKRPDSMQTKEITQEQLESLRAAAARVYVYEKDPEDKSSEVNTVAAGNANVKEEAGFDNGVQLLAAAATKIKTEEERKEQLASCEGKKHP